MLRMQQFCLLTKPPRWKWAFSQMMVSRRNCGPISGISRTQLPKTRRCRWSAGLSSSFIKNQIVMKNMLKLFLLNTSFQRHGPTWVFSNTFGYSSNSLSWQHASVLIFKSVPVQRVKNKWNIRLHFRRPCFIYYQAFPEMIKGAVISDAIVTLSSMNVIAGELDG